MMLLKSQHRRRYPAAYLINSVSSPTQKKSHLSPVTRHDRRLVTLVYSLPPFRVYHGSVKKNNSPSLDAKNAWTTRHDLHPVFFPTNLSRDP